MGIAFTTGPVYYETLDSSTSASFRADIGKWLVNAGWSGPEVSGSANIYEFTTLQMMKGKLKIWDDGTMVGSANVINLQILNDAESALGIIHHLAYGSVMSSFTYKINVSSTWCFITLLGIDGNIGFLSSYSFSCGGLFLPQDLAGQCASPTPNTITEIIWSEGSGDNTQVAFNFRNAASHTDIHGISAAPAVYSFIVNGVAFLSSGGTLDQHYGVMQYYTLLGTYNGTFNPQYPQSTIYGTTLPLFIDALMGWEGQIQGQLYDAMVATAALNLDQTFSTMEPDFNSNDNLVPWISWNRPDFSSLILRNGPEIPVVSPSAPWEGGYAY